MRKLVILTVFVAVLLTACSSKATGFKFSDLPAGDAAHGAILFNQSNNGSAACSNCHSVSGGTGAGPSLDSFATVAGSRVGGQSAQDYAFNSILRPSKHLVSGFSNIMPTNYESKLTHQEIADMISYLMTLGGSGTSTAAKSSGGGGGKSVDTYMLVFRLLHIFAASFWFGAGLFMILFLEPTVKTSASGQRFMQAFLKTTKFGIAMPVSAILTTIAGVALYYRVSDHFNADWMSSTAGIVLSIGATCGVAAFLHGAAVIGPSTSKMTRLLDELGKQETPLTEEQSAHLHQVLANASLHGRISAGLIAVAMACMISARYL